MLNLRQSKNKLTAKASARALSLSWGTDMKVRRRVTASAMHLIRSLPRNRREKVLGIRKQLAEGTYNMDKRLETVLERLLKDVVA
jgi:anti-sigma28 factor (negative regulator of flagellin synthesis)